MIGELFSGSLWLRLSTQATLCVAAGLAASYLMHHRAARAHRVLLISLVVAVVTPGTYVLARHFQLGLLPSKPMSVPPQTPEPTLSFGTFVTDLPTAEADFEPLPSGVREPVATAPVPWGTICLSGWALLSTMLLGRLVVQFFLGLRLVKKARPSESERLRQAMESARDRMHITRSVRIRCSERIESPVIWCWTRQPVLLVHAQPTDPQDNIDWVGVFCHELAHLKRRDHLSGLFVETLTALLPWHLLLWWTRTQLVRLSEQACDDWVLAAGQSDVDYAETLLGLAAQRQLAFVPTVIGKEKNMNMRIRRIIRNRCPDPKIGTRWAAVVSLLAILAVVSVGFAQRRPVEPRERALETNAEQPVPEERRQEAPDWQREVLHRKLDELVGQIRDKEAMLREAREMPPEERRMQEFELDLLRDMTAQVERRLQNLEPPEPEMGPGSREVNELGMPIPVREREELAQARRQMEREQAVRRDDLAKTLDNLSRQAGEIEQQLRSLDNRETDRGRALEMELDRTRMQIGEVEEQLRLLERESARPVPEPEVRARRRTVTRTPDRDGIYRGERPLVRVEEPSTTMRRAPGEDRGRTETRVYVLQNRDAERTRAILETLIKEPETVTVFASGTKVAVNTTAENHLRIEGVLKALAVPEADRGRPEDRLVTIIYELQHADPAQTREIVQSLLGESGKTTSDNRSRSLIVTATSEKQRSIQSILSRLDTPTNNPASKTEIDELRDQMRQLQERMQQMQKRLEQVGERAQESQTKERPADTEESLPRR